MSTILEPDPRVQRTVADDESADLLRHRAESLRAQARHLPEVLAVTYRRRASELELEAWVREVEAGVPYDRIRPAA